MSLTLIHPRCEHLTEPLGIGTGAPRFSWELHGTQRDLRQATYRLRVGKTPSLPANGAELIWDSGEVPSGAQHEVVYAGQPLKIRSGYYWQVSVQAEPGAEVVTHPPQYFETGFFDIRDWDSEWIGYQWSHLRCDKRTVNHLRREFTVEREIRRARAYVASTSGAYYDDTLRMNLYELRLNGEKVGEDFLNPGQLSDRRGRALYRTYDITAALRVGANAVGLIFLSSKISLQLWIESTDGSVTIINTNAEGWRCQDQGPFTRLWKFDGDEYGGKGEVYDARNEYTGWDLPGFDAAAWQPVLIGSPAEVMAAQLQSVQAGEILAPTSISKRGPGRFVADFGRNLNGHVVLRTKGETGSPITLRFAEYARGESEIAPASTYGYRDQEASVHEDIYIKKSDEAEVYAPRFSNHGFRYAEISGYGGELTEEDIQARFVHSTVLNGSRFDTSDPWVRRLHRLSEQCCLSNLASIPTDCPSRERQAWLGDAGISLSLAHCTQFDMRLFYEKWFNDIADMQESSGYLPYICPFRTFGLYGMDIPWSTGAVVAAWESYQAYGDKTFLARFYPMLKKWADFVVRLPLQEGLSSGHTRWNDHMAEPHYSLDFLENAYAFRTLDLLSKIAGTLGENASAAFYREKAEARRDAINHRFLRDDACYDSKNVQGSNAHALYFGLVPEARQAAVLSKMVENLEQEKHFATGVIGTISLIMVLAENGRNDLVYQLVKSDAPRTWGYWLTHYDATTALESWVHDPCSQGSTHNHPMLIGGLLAWLYRELAGIKPLEPGYKRVSISPFVPQGMHQASAVVHSAHGAVKSAWVQESGQFSLEVEIPANTTAEIRLPNLSGAVVYEGREEARHAVGVHGEHHEKGATVLDVGSGTYTFRVNSLCL